MYIRDQYQSWINKTYIVLLYPAGELPSDLATSVCMGSVLGAGALLQVGNLSVAN